MGLGQTNDGRKRIRLEHGFFQHKRVLRLRYLRQHQCIARPFAYAHERIYIHIDFLPQRFLTGRTVEIPSQVDAEFGNDGHAGDIADFRPAMGTLIFPGGIVTTRHAGLYLQPKVFGQPPGIARKNPERPHIALQTVVPDGRIYRPERKSDPAHIEVAPDKVGPHKPLGKNLGRPPAELRRHQYMTPTRWVLCIPIPDPPTGPGF